MRPGIIVSDYVTAIFNALSIMIALHASACAREREACAARTSRWIPASAVPSPDGGHPDAHARVRGDGAGNDPAPTARRTSRDSPVIIDSSKDASPSTIRPSAGTRAPGRTRTTSPTWTSAHRDARVSMGLDDLGVVRQQRGERVQRAGRLPERLHLLPVPEEHHVDQQRELPPELEIEPAGLGRGARDERHEDRERDQQHHPGLPVADLADAAAQERHPAVEEHDRADERRDPTDIGKLGAVNPSHSWIISDQISTGIVSATLSQNRSRNIATL